MRALFPSLLVAGLALACGSAAAQSQMYKWKDAAGVTHYSDSAPAGHDAKTLDVAPRQDAAPSLPYEVARAARAYPVVLYTTAECGTCDQGRALLRARGVPFVEKTVATAADRQQLHKAGGGNELPLLTVGRDHVPGFRAPAWHSALDAAAYPRQVLLPAGYKTGVAAPASGPAVSAPPPVQPAPEADAAPAQQPARQQPKKRQETDFQF